ncbi:MAG: roadblock/LC7 domain-containing protein [Thiotrichales bacterium]
MARANKLDQLVQSLMTGNSQVDIAAVISLDGLVLASQMSRHVDSDRLGALSAALLSLGERASEELGRGGMEQVLVKGELGYVIMIRCGDHACLSVVTQATAKLGMIFLDVKRKAREIEAVMLESSSLAS